MAGMELAFTGEIIYWRGPSPFHFIATPEAESDEIGAVAKRVTYGWGCIPVAAEIGRTHYTTSLFPKNGGYLVPVKAAVRRAEKLDVGDTVKVRVLINLG